MKKSYTIGIISLIIGFILVRPGSFAEAVKTLFATAGMGFLIFLVADKLLPEDKK